MNCVLHALPQGTLLRPRDLKRLRLPGDCLWQLARQGLVQNFGRGVYGMTDHPLTENHSYAVVCKLVPHGVICLLSALRIHNLTTQNPSQVWLALDRKARAPSITNPQLKIVRFSARALTEGIEEKKVEGVLVRFYSVAKTVVDLFKYRHKVGLDVAMEALRASLRERRCTMDELQRYARICRMERVMRPYLEMETFS